MAFWRRRRPQEAAQDDGAVTARPPDARASSGSAATGVASDGGGEEPSGTKGSAQPRPGIPERRPLIDRPVIRAGIYSWAIGGILALVIAGAFAVAAVSLVVIPLVLALFPAAVLMPVADRLKRRLPRALAATCVLVGFIAVLVTAGALLAPQVAAEMEGIGASAREGITQLERLLAGPPFNLGAGALDRLIDQGITTIQQSPQFRAGVLTAVSNIVEVAAGLAILLIALFFYLKDGDRIARWLKSLFPQRAQADAEQIGTLSWQVIGGYMRGQLAVALIDAVLIGVGLAILRIPLALPLAVVVFVGGLFPIVGAFVAGALAVLVALATQGPFIALLVLLLIIGVQQVEGNLLAPIVLGRATALHPLAVIAVLTGGALLLGVLGAFIAVPVAASGARAVGYLRTRTPG